MRMTLERELRVKKIESFLAEKIRPILEQDEKARECLRAKELYLSTFNYGWPSFFTKEKAEVFAMKHRGLRVNEESGKRSLFNMAPSMAEKIALDNYYYVEECKLNLERVEEKLEKIANKLSSTHTRAKDVGKLEAERRNLENRRNEYKKVIDADAEIERLQKENPFYLSKCFFDLYQAQIRAVKKVIKENPLADEVAFMIEDVLDKYRTADEDAMLYRSAMFALKNDAELMEEVASAKDVVSRLATAVNNEIAQKENQDKIQDEEIENE